MTMLAKKPYLLFIFIACLTITLCFTTCKKYPEDNFYSLKNPEKRVVGSWELIEYNFNGSSIISALNDKLKTFDIKELGLIVTAKQGKVLQKYYFTPAKIGNGNTDPLLDNSKFAFTGRNTNKFADSVQNLLFLTPQSFKGNGYTKWDIRNLYKNKMHLQLNTDSGNYDIYFEKIRN